jgi:hypothetical protein
LLPAWASFFLAGVLLSSCSLEMKVRLKMVSPKKNSRLRHAIPARRNVSGAVFEHDQGNRSICLERFYQAKNNGKFIRESLYLSVDEALAAIAVLRRGVDACDKLAARQQRLKKLSEVKNHKQAVDKALAVGA